MFGDTDYTGGPGQQLGSGHAYAVGHTRVVVELVSQTRLPDASELPVFGPLLRLATTPSYGRAL